MSNAMPTATFSASLTAKPAPLLHTWEHTVGSGHATLALRSDWQRQLRRASRELGFRYVRFHGILSDDMGTLVDEDERLVYSFFNADQICDFLLSIGMRPFVELSFMPTTLSSGDTTVFHYRANVTPPKDYGVWSTLIRTLVQHWVDRYGGSEVDQWFFEVWNEPNLQAFWTGSQSDYFKLYRHTAAAIKGVRQTLKVGGPATADNEWINDFMAFCAENQAPVDFVSTHHYPTDAFGKPGDDTVAQLAASHRSVLRDEARESKNQSRGKPLYYTEWSTSSNPFDSLHDQPYAAAFIVKTVLECRDIVQGYSYWTFSDIFEENYFTSDPFHGGFGLTTIHGIPKPAYRAYELLHRLGKESIPCDGGHPTVDVWIARADQEVQVILSNSALPKHAIMATAVSLRITDIANVASACIERIDEAHANPRAVWERMGSPKDLHPTLVNDLEAASLLIKEKQTVSFEHGVASLEVVMPPQGVAMITLKVM